jgi:hypothetical protein
VAHLSTCLLSQRKLDTELTAALVERTKASPTVKYDPSFCYALPKETMEAYVAGDPYLAAVAELCGTMNFAANIHTGGKSGENGLYKPLQVAVLVAHSGEGEPVRAMGGSEEKAYDRSDLPLPKGFQLYGSKTKKLINLHGWAPLVTPDTRILTHLKVDTSSLPRGTDGKLSMPTIAEEHREWAAKLFPEASIAKEGRKAAAKATIKTKAAKAEEAKHEAQIELLCNVFECEQPEQQTPAERQAYLEQLLEYFYNTWQPTVLEAYKACFALNFSDGFSDDFDGRSV